MLKVRIIPCLTIKDLRLVKSIQFSEHRNIGSYIAAVRVFNMRDVDEMMVLDLDATHTGIKPWLLQEITKECFMPLSLGGGIKTVEDISMLLRLGADKVVINTSAVNDPSFIDNASAQFGSQCIVVSIDAKLVNGEYHVFTNGGRKNTRLRAVVWAQEVTKRGAGEIFLTSIDRDGEMNGYDLSLVKSVSEAVTIPVIAGGGAGNMGDCLKVIQEGGASALSAGSIFQYTEVTPLAIKEHLAKNGIATRI
ncbi:MAG: cyclase [Parcubacteria group bacterium Greene0416_79]|nr:MAG: cyclase [Parcubacteria group bacterium Greene0416_79]